MDNYPSYSYPDSGDSSPRSREIDFENPPPSWEEQQPQPPLNHKVKFMVSYGGKIQPRSHDNLLSYVGGETKILSLDRNIKFNSLFSKLSSIISPDSEVVSGFTFKYQLPGEELDALISVTNDDDLENMMHEYDRLYRGSSKPARLRLFLFPVGSKSGSFGSTCSDPGKIERDSDRFVEALNSGHTVHTPPPSQPQVVAPPPPPQVTNNVDFLFGLEKQHQQIPHPHHHPAQVPVPVQVSDPQIDARIQDLNRMHISGPKHESDPNVYTGAPASIPASVQVPAQYWQPQPPPVNVEQQPPPQPHHHPQFHHQPPPPPQQQHQHLQPQQQQHQQPPPPQQQQQQHHPQQAVYMMHPGPPPPQQGNMMHAPPQMMRPPPTQGYYQVRVPEQQQQQPPPPQQQHQQQPVYNMNPGKMGGYSESMGLPVRPVPGMAQDNHQGYTQVAYDNGSGRQVYYAAQQQQQQQQQGGGGGSGGGGGVVTTSYQGAAVSGGDMRNMAAESKVVQKVVPTSNSAV